MNISFNTDFKKLKEKFLICPMIFIKIFLIGISLFSTSNIENYPESRSQVFKSHGFSEDCQFGISKYYIRIQDGSNTYVQLEQISHSYKSIYLRKFSAFLSHIFSKHCALLEDSENKPFKVLFLKATKDDNHPILCLLYLKIIHDFEYLYKMHEYDTRLIQNTLDDDLLPFRTFNRTYGGRFIGTYKNILKNAKSFLYDFLENSEGIIIKLENGLDISDDMEISNTTEQMKIHFLKLGILNNMKLFINLMEISLILIKMCGNSLKKPNYAMEKEMSAVLLNNKLTDASERLLYYLVGYNPSICNQLKHYFGDSFIDTSVSEKLSYIISAESHITAVEGATDTNIERIVLPPKANPTYKKEEGIVPDITFQDYISKFNTLQIQNPGREFKNKRRKKKGKEELFISEGLASLVDSDPRQNPRIFDSSNPKILANDYSHGFNMKDLSFKSKLNQNSKSDQLSFKVPNSMKFSRYLRNNYANHPSRIKRMSKKPSTMKVVDENSINHSDHEIFASNESFNYNYPNDSFPLEDKLKANQFESCLKEEDINPEDILDESFIWQLGGFIVQNIPPSKINYFPETCISDANNPSMNCSSRKNEKSKAIKSSKRLHPVANKDEPFNSNGRKRLKK